MVPVHNRKKPRWRQTAEVVIEKGKPRSLCVALEPMAIAIRTKGSRQVMRVPWRKVWWLSCFLEANRMRAEKAATRKNRRKIA